MGRARMWSDDRDEGQWSWSVGDLEVAIGQWESVGRGCYYEQMSGNAHILVICCSKVDERPFRWNISPRL